jgi:hypothetical protein
VGSNTIEWKAYPMNIELVLDLARISCINNKNKSMYALIECNKSMLTREDNMEFQVQSWQREG